MPSQCWCRELNSSFMENIRDTQLFRLIEQNLMDFQGFRTE